MNVYNLSNFYFLTQNQQNPIQKYPHITELFAINICSDIFVAMIF